MVIGPSAKMPTLVKSESRLEQIKAEAKNENPEQMDDSLTSLNWLQEVKINISNDVTSIAAPYSPVPSTNSDDCRSEDLYEGMKQEIEDDQVIDYKTNPHYKPPYSYATLICMAMKEANLPKMTLSAIYRWITDNFVYYKYADQSWQVCLYDFIISEICLTNFSILFAFHQQTYSRNMKPLSVAAFSLKPVR